MLNVSGTFVPAEGAHATVVLVHGFKNTRAEMVDYARFLHDAGYAVLLYDSRGCGDRQTLSGLLFSSDLRTETVRLT